MPIALFDVDKTIVDGSTNVLAARYLQKHNMVNARHAATSIYYWLLRKIRFIEYDILYDRIAQFLLGLQESLCIRMGHTIFRDMIQGRIFEEAHDRILAHKTQGHQVALITGSFKFLAEPLKDFLDVHRVFAVSPKIKNGVLTGKLLEPLSYGDGGKEFYARKFAEENGSSLGEAYFYGDSMLDISLLSKVGNPYAVNPDRKLRKYALKNNIPILSFRRRLSGESSG